MVANERQGQDLHNEGCNRNIGAGQGEEAEADGHPGARGEEWWVRSSQGRTGLQQCGGGGGAGSRTWQGRGAAHGGKGGPAGAKGAAKVGQRCHRQVSTSLNTEKSPAVSSEIHYSIREVARDIN